MSSYFDDFEFPAFDWGSIPKPSQESHYIAGAGSKIGLSTANNIRTITATGNGNDTFFARDGRSTVDGGGGIDTYEYTDSRASFSVSIAAHKTTVIGPKSSDSLTSVERLQFTDGTLALDIDGNAGQAYRLYQSAFDRAPDLQGLDFWIDHLDSGESLSWVADRFIDSDEFGILYGENVSNAAFVSALYQNILGREGDEGGVAYWNAELDSGNRSRTDVLIGFSESEENIVGVAPSISDGIWLG